MIEAEREPLQLARQAFHDLSRTDYLTRIDELVQEFPGNEELRAMRTVGVLSVGDLDRAERYANEHFSATQSPQSVAARSFVAAFNGDKTAAKGLSERALATGIRSPVILTAAVKIASSGEEHEVALSLAEELLVLEPEEPGNYSLLLNVLRGAGRIDEVEKRLADAPSWYRGTYQEAIQRAHSVSSRRDMVARESILREAVAMRPNNSTAWASLGFTLESQGRFDEAETAAQYALEHNPRSVTALRVLSSVAEHRGDLTAAGALNSEARKAIPAMHGIADAHAGAQFMIHGQNPEALRAFRVALRSSLSARERRVALAGALSVLRVMGKWEDLRKEIDGLTEEDVDGQSLGIARARILDVDGKSLDAAQLLESLLKSSKDRGSVRSELIWIQAKLGNKQRLDELVAALNEDPPGSPPQAALVIGALLMAKRPADADLILANSLRQFPNSPHLRRFEARRLLRNGQPEMAKHIVGSLPAHMRRNFDPMMRLTGSQLAKALAKALWRRIKRRKPKS